MRINVQLIDASNDKHLWAQVYDRELTDVFAIQSELAQEIASALKATLSPDEQERIERKPTRKRRRLPSLSAGARDLHSAGPSSRRSGARGTTLRAGDPARSVVRARLRASRRIWKAGSITRSNRCRRARRKRGAAASEALRLQPESAGGASGARLRPLLRRSRLRSRPERARHRADGICRTTPGSFARWRRSSAGRENGNESNANYEKAVSLNPKDPILLENHGYELPGANETTRRQRRIFDRAVQAAPDTFTIRELRARIDFDVERRSPADADSCSRACRKTSIRTGRSPWRATI